MEIPTCQNCGMTIRQGKAGQLCGRCSAMQIPTPEEIEAMCEAIRAKWSDAELARREVSAMTEPRVPIVPTIGVRRRNLKDAD